MTALLDRCAALIEKIGRGPVWKDGASRRTLVFDARWQVKIEHPGLRFENRTDHEVVCILEKWLRGLLVEAGCIITDRDSSCVVAWKEPLGEVSFIWHYEPNKQAFTAFITAAEKVLLPKEGVIWLRFWSQ